MYEHEWQVGCETLVADAHQASEFGRLHFCIDQCYNITAPEKEVVFSHNKQINVLDIAKHYNFHTNKCVDVTAAARNLAK